MSIFGCECGDQLFNGHADLIQAPPLLERGEGSSTFMMIVLNIAVAVPYMPVSG
jgi:hypothetical protein